MKEIGPTLMHYIAAHSVEIVAAVSLVALAIVAISVLVLAWR